MAITQTYWLPVRFSASATAHSEPPPAPHSVFLMPASSLMLVLHINDEENRDILTIIIVTTCKDLVEIISMNKTKEIFI